MLAIAVNLLAERYTATYFNDRSKPEWPPHPARLFYAMVAAWADSDAPDPEERAALQWLERQPPPGINCGKAGHRAVVTHFVPVNDATAFSRNLSGGFHLMAEARTALEEAVRSGDKRRVKRARTTLGRTEAKAVADAARAGSLGQSSTPPWSALEVLPEYRGKQGRTYPTVLPAESTCWFIWDKAEPDEALHRALDQILARVGRIGHSSTLVSCRLDPAPPPAAWIPAADRSEMLRVPAAGLLDRLELAFQVHQASDTRLLPSRMAGYRRVIPAEVRPVTPVLGGDWIVLGIRGNRLPRPAWTVDVARAVRNSLLAHAEQPPSEFISGHQPAGPRGTRPTRPLDRPHLAVVPLPSAGHFRSDGAISAVALVMPATRAAAERDAVEDAVRNWARAGFELLVPGGAGQRALRLFLEDLGIDRADRSARPGTGTSGRRKTATRGYWCRPARRWATATPIALDRFPGNLRSREQASRERAEQEAESYVAMACAHVGLPQPSVTIRLDALLTGLPGAPVGHGQAAGQFGRRFPPYRTGSGTPRACVHAEIEFDTPVSGPVLLGAGRYFGYGLCLPLSKAGES